MVDGLAMPSRRRQYSALPLLVSELRHRDHLSLLFLILTGLDLPVPLGSVPLCARGRAGCQSLSLAGLFDRMIQHSARMHGLSNDLHSEFEQYFLPSQNQVGRTNRKCHTSTILTPDGKENAQSLPREELTGVILKLLLAWRDPLSWLHQKEALNEDSSGFSGRAQEMSDMAHKLRSGVEMVTEKMQLLGMIRNSLGSLSSAEAQLPPSPGGQTRSMTDYELIHCFRRDSDKVLSYLKVLKCRIVPDHGC